MTTTTQPQRIMTSRTHTGLTGEYDVVLTRADGWTLAAPLRYLAAAWAMWQGQWTSAQTRDGRALPVGSLRALRGAL